MNIKTLILRFSTLLLMMVTFLIHYLEGSEVAWTIFYSICCILVLANIAVDTFERDKMKKEAKNSAKDETVDSVEGETVDSVGDDHIAD